MARRLDLDVYVDAEQHHRAMRDDVYRGLTMPEKRLSPIWFYDEVGSRLFDEITRLPEYYLTRAESEILAAYADDIVASGVDTLVEIGSGTSEKTRLLLDAMAAAGSLRRVVLFDISSEVLMSAAERIGADYDVDVHVVVGDFSTHLPKIPRGGRRLWAFLGSTIGNLTPPERAGLLADFRTSMTDEDELLLGTDLVKDPARLLLAYNDPTGTTAAFNRNVLTVLNRELRAGFDPELFTHSPMWNSERQWVEMRLRARSTHSVTVADFDLTVEFQRDEDIRTEISAKFTPARIRDELAAQGLAQRAAWTDARGDFQLTLAGPESAGGDS